MKQRGSVLMSVLWIILVLSLVSFSLAATVRVEVESVNHAFESEKAFLMAKGAAEIVFNSYSKRQPIPDDTPIREVDGEYIFPFEAGEARVQFSSDAGLVDVNEASDKVLASMLDSLALDREMRNRLVDSILDWIDTDDIPHLYGGEVADYPPVVAGKMPRPRNGKFETVEELLLVRNMTPEIFFGSLVVDRVAGRYHRIPGLRELVTVRSGQPGVDPNRASAEVLTALPLMNSSIAAQIVAERSMEPFANAEDLVKRVPVLGGQETLDYMKFGGGGPTELVARAVIKASGISRTVRLLFKREEVLQIIVRNPLLYKRTLESKFDRWRFE